MPASAKRADGVSRRLTPLQSGKPVECSTVFGLKVPPGGFHHLPARNNHDIYACQRFTTSEQLANQPFGPIPHDRVSDFLAGRNAEAR